MSTHNIGFRGKIRKIFSRYPPFFFFFFFFFAICIICIAPDKRDFPIIMFIFLLENICCRYSLEAPL